MKLKWARAYRPWLCMCLFFGLSLCVYAAQPVVVVLDPGHGGKDVGAVGVGKVYENVVTLSVAKRLAGLFNLTPGFQVRLTRTGNYYVNLWNRMQIARRAKANLFISIHADAFTNARARGASVFILSQKGASTAAARWLSRRDNRSDFATGVSISDQSRHVASTLIDMTQTKVMQASHALAKDLLGQLGKVTRLHGNYVERAPFMVLKSPDIPSVLVEIGFLTNPGEANRLRTSSFRDTLARALYLGIIQYVSKHAPYGSYVAIKGMPKYLTYVVKKGDTLSKIARYFCMPWRQLKQVENLKSTRLKIGQSIHVPIKRLGV